MSTFIIENICRRMKLEIALAIPDLNEQELNSAALKFRKSFNPLEVVSRYADPQLQVGENYSYFTPIFTPIFWT